MIADGCLKPRKNETPRQRFERLNTTFNTLSQEIMGGLASLPAEEQMKVADKLCALKRIHQALLDENTCKPRR